MSNKKANSDKSNRAERRRQDKAIQKAQKIVNANPQAQATPISMTNLLTKIGALTIEVDVLREQLSVLRTSNVEAVVEKMKEEEVEVVEENED